MMNFGPSWHAYTTTGIDIINYTNNDKGLIFSTPVEENINDAKSRKVPQDSEEATKIN